MRHILWKKGVTQVRLFIVELEAVVLYLVF